MCLLRDASSASLARSCPYWISPFKRFEFNFFWCVLLTLKWGEFVGAQSYASTRQWTRYLAAELSAGNFQWRTWHGWISEFPADLPVLSSSSLSFCSSPPPPPLSPQYWCLNAAPYVDDARSTLLSCIHNSPFWLLCVSMCLCVCLSVNKCM